MDKINLKFKNVLTKLRDVVFPQSVTIDEAESISRGIEQHILAAYNQHKALKEMYQLLVETAHDAGGFIWRKDANGRYLFANRTMCNNLLVPDQESIRSNKDCTEEVLGYTDEEIISKYIMRTGDINTFRTTLSVADMYAMASGERTKFIEFGEIQGQPRVLQTVRTPVFNSRSVVEGTVGFAMDISDYCDEVLSKLYGWRLAGNATQIHPSIFVIHKGDTACEMTQTFVRESLPDELGA